MLSHNDTPEAAGGKLHDVAMTAEKALEQLATGLGQAGADPRAVKAISQCADVTRRVAKALAQPSAQAVQPQPAQPHTIDSATEAMMADRRAATQQ